MTDPQNAKPCPFCGFDKTRFVDWIVEFTPTNKHVELAVSCRNCGAQGPNMLDRASAVRMWNLRRDQSWWKG